MGASRPPRNSTSPDDENRPVFRFAPSPNGLLHLGHAYSALLNLEMARAAYGIMLLRIEDIDRERCTAQNEARMLEDLEWIGFEWDALPMRQSENFARYAGVIDDLFEAGLAYPATLSRREIADAIEKVTESGGSWPRDPDGSPLYPGAERDMSREARQAIVAGGKNYAMRLDIARALERGGRDLVWLEDGAGPHGETGIVPADPSSWGDVVIARKDVPASYHLSVVLDDAAQGITNIVRGRDLFHATSVHRLLQEILGLAVPVYHHHDLILDSDGHKLSKSRRSTALRHLREAGMTPADIRRLIGLDGSSGRAGA